MNPPRISVVIPVYNEAENLGDLHRELTASLQSLGQPYEILLVDDGSQDGTSSGCSPSRPATRACACCA